MSLPFQFDSDGDDTPLSVPTSSASSQNTTGAADNIDALVNYGINTYPRNIWVVVLCVLGVVIVYNIIYTLWAWRRRSTSSQRSQLFTSSSQGQSHKTSGFTRIPAAILTASRIFSFRLRIPLVNMTFLEIFLTLGYIVLLVSYCFVNTQGLDARFWSNRSGAIAAAQIPLIIALSSKNNAIGCESSCLNLLHRVFSRVMLIMIFIHWAGVAEPDNTGADNPYWTGAGQVAAVVMTILAAVSFKWIRARFYETFYLVHMILIIIFIVAAWIHLDGALTGYSYLLWPGVIVWGVDRFIRYTFYFIHNTLFKPSKSLGILELISPDTLRLTIKRRFVGGWIAGQHMFLSFPSVNPTQSHPFSISTLSDGDDSERDLVFVMRVRKGLTKTLKERVVQKGNNIGMIELPVFMDGPYGLPTDITGFSTCIFIAGGSGITYILPRLEDLIRRASSSRAQAHRISFVWIIRERFHIQWFGDRLRNLTSSTPNLSISFSIYVTSNTEQVQLSFTTNNNNGNVQENIPMSSYISSERTSQADLEKSGPPVYTFTAQGQDELPLPQRANFSSSDRIGFRMESQPNVNIYQGRPNVRMLLEEEVLKSEGPVSVDVSGPSPLIASVRSSLSSSFAGPANVLEGGPTVQLNVEEFSM
ncbi:ferric reductase NAD binding domain-containing protein [Abortiporus biennis]|nr:ferric reductase NAD binding domain-containing protein [Abortiporus biennis]